MARSHPFLALVTALYLVLIATFTFVGGDEQPPSPVWALITFIGVGMLLTVMSTPRRWWVALGFGLLGAAWIEAAQSVWRPAGYASIADLAFGALGTVIGVGIVVGVRWFRSRSATRAPRTSTAVTTTASPAQPVHPRP